MARRYRLNKDFAVDLDQVASIRRCHYIYKGEPNEDMVELTMVGGGYVSVQLDNEDEANKAMDLLWDRWIDERGIK